MPNNKNPLETLDERHVTKTWIKENFDLDQHRQETDATDTIMTRSIEKEEPGVLDHKDVQALQDVYNKGGTVMLTKYNRGSFFNDHDEVAFQSRMPRPETDKEVTDRLQEEQQKAIRRERQKEKKRKEKEQNDKAIAEMEERASSVQFEI